MNHVLLQGVVFGLNALIRLLHIAEVANLLLQLLDVALFTLTERTLHGSQTCILSVTSLGDSPEQLGSGQHAWSYLAPSLPCDLRRPCRGATDHDLVDHRGGLGVGHWTSCWRREDNRLGFGETGGEEKAPLMPKREGWLDRDNRQQTEAVRRGQCPAEAVQGAGLALGEAWCWSRFG